MTVLIRFGDATFTINFTKGAWWIYRRKHHVFAREKVVAGPFKTAAEAAKRLEEL